MVVQVLITGSREATPEMRRKAREVVAWCKEQGHEVIVGDAPGIDRVVRLTCLRLQVPVTVFGAYDTIRDPELGATWERRVLTRGTYPARDRAMARQCSLCVGIWNGVSRGTKITMDAAETLGKRVITRIFAG